MADAIEIRIPNYVGDTLEGDGEFEAALESAVGHVLVRYDIPEDVEIRVEWVP